MGHSVDTSSASHPKNLDTPATFDWQDIRRCNKLENLKPCLQKISLIDLKFFHAANLCLVHTLDPGLG